MEALILSTASAFESGNETDICNKLQEFNKENAQTFGFPELGTETKKKFMSDLLHTLETRPSDECHILCLEALRILSREKHRMHQLKEKDGVHLLLKLARLSDDAPEVGNQIIIEAQKCLCNLVFNSEDAQRICSESNYVAHIMNRVKLYSEPNITYDIKFFDMRLLFLLTALCPELREKVRKDLNGIPLLVQVLETDTLASVFKSQCAASVGASEDLETLTDDQANLACEVLKALFNTIIHANLSDLEGVENKVLEGSGRVLKYLLLTVAGTDTKTEEYHNQTINLLTCHLPQQIISEMIPEPDGGAVGGAAIYNGRNMDTMVVILNFLEKRLDRAAANKQRRLAEQLSPVISALCVLSRTEPIIRRFLKEQVLPPLDAKEAASLPEEGNTLRNKLVRLMTNPSTDVKEVVADFLFILCKESVTRLVKYTGYGNAAGMLARRGLLAGGQGNTDYSSDEGDSDTEDYLEVRNKVNPVTGRVEEERRNPMEGMTEEQKEFHAAELAEMIDRITREGVIKPMSVSPDGKLVPMDEYIAATRNQWRQALEEESEEDDDDDSDVNDKINVKETGNRARVKRCVCSSDDVWMCDV
ncbi:chaperone Ric-8A-like [Amphiura filiformis]|uniref:chaperone Ric-8A-like n=1 Tax=Amphiura filiformis TaxID=82378 RepID=UPI003B20D2EC